LGRFLSLPSLPDAVNGIVNPIWSELRKRREKAGHDEIAAAILDIRARFDPPLDVDAVERTMTLVFVVSGEYGDVGTAAGPESLTTVQAAERWQQAADLIERARVLEAYCHALVGTTAPKPPLITSLDVEVVGEHDFSYADLRSTDALRIEAMSP
jgi:hypothetical protein